MSWLTVSLSAERYCLSSNNSFGFSDNLNAIVMGLFGVVCFNAIVQSSFHFVLNVNLSRAQGARSRMFIAWEGVGSMESFLFSIQSIFKQVLRFLFFSTGLSACTILVLVSPSIVCKTFLNFPFYLGDHRLDSISV